MPDHEYQLGGSSKYSESGTNTTKKNLKAAAESNAIFIDAGNCPLDLQTEEFPDGSEPLSIVFESIEDLDSFVTLIARNGASA